MARFFLENFQYSTWLQGAHRGQADQTPLAHFLLNDRAGHCEYFASAMAVMLREVWIPSRVATGFLGGTYNPLAGWYVVHASEAHSWVEAWIPGRGWTIFDPTPPDLEQRAPAGADWGNSARCRLPAGC